MQAPKVNRMPAPLRVDFLLPSPRVKDIDTAWSVIRKSGSRFSEAIMLHERGGNRFTLPIAALGPCGGTGRRARLKIVFRKEWGFDSLHGHHHHKSLLKRFIFFLSFPTLLSRGGNFCAAFVP